MTRIDTAYDLELTPSQAFFSGVDTHFIVWLVIFVASVVLFALAARKTLAARQET